MSSHLIYEESITSGLDIPTLIATIPLPIIRLCYLGDSSCMHRMISSYIGLRCHDKAYTELVDFRFYCLPYSRNILTDYLAMTDIIYRKQIYSLFQSPDLVPSLERHEDKSNPVLIYYIIGNIKK